MSFKIFDYGSSVCSRRKQEASGCWVHYKGYWDEYWCLRMDYVLYWKEKYSWRVQGVVWWMKETQWCLLMHLAPNWESLSLKEGAGCSVKDQEGLISTSGVPCTQLRAQGEISRVKEVWLSTFDVLCAQLREGLFGGCNSKRQGELVSWECAMCLRGVQGCYTNFCSSNLLLLDGPKYTM